MQVVGTAKNAGTVYAGHLLFGNQVTALQIWGYGLSLAGFLLYNVGKALPFMNASKGKTANDAEARDPVDESAAQARR